MVYGLILASGLAKRMGSDKLLLPWRGKPLIDHLLMNIAQAPIDELLIVTSQDRLEYIKNTAQYNSQVILNPSPQLGMGHSLALGIHHLPTKAEAVVILLADQPELAIEDISQVIQLFRKHKTEKIIIHTEYKDGKVGHPILFSKHFFYDLSRLHGDVGGRLLIQNHLENVKRIQSNNDYPIDIDTVEDYDRLLQKE